MTSLSLQYKVFKDLIDLIDDCKARNPSLITPLNIILDRIKKQTEIFFTINDQSNFDNTIIDLYFQSIILSIKAFDNFFDFLKSNNEVEKDEMSNILTTFTKDFKQYIIQLTQILAILTESLENLLKSKTPSSISDFLLKIEIFKSSINIQKSDMPPYYTMTILPIIEFYEQITNSHNRFLNVAAPSGMGKTSLVPFLLASKLFKNNKLPHFIIVVEQKTSSINYIKDKYNEILNNKKDDDEGENEGENLLSITTSLSNIIGNVNDNQFNGLSICILSPFDAFQLLRTVPNLQNFVSNSTFVFDDFELRSYETEILISFVHREIMKLRRNDGLSKLVMMSTVTDKSFLSFFGQYDEISINSEYTRVDKKVIKSKCMNDLLEKNLFIEMKKFFETWISNSQVDIGSVIVFVPNEKVGNFLYKKIFDFFSKENSVEVCPLHTTINKYEKLDSFYCKLFYEIGEEEEKTESYDKQTLFLMPMNLTGQITKEEIEIANSKLPYPFKKKFSRVLITTIENENLLHVQDPMIIFDTGIDEVEIFDIKESSMHKVNELVPEILMEKHQKILKNDGLYFEFIIENKKRPESSFVPRMKSCDISKIFLELRHFGFNLESLHFLPKEINHTIMNDCIELMKKIDIINSPTNALTLVGQNASRYFTISPFFALATSKFTDNQQFGFLCSLVIENANSLVTNTSSNLLCRHFNKDSDVVTLLDAIFEVSQGEIENYEDMGLSIGVIHSIYSQIENAFNIDEGKKAVVEAIEWSRGQNGGTFGMVDKFINSIHPEFINKRKFSFVHVLNAAPNKTPTFVYKAKENNSLIKFSTRPGQLGLQSPGNILALSIIINEEEEEDNRNNYCTIVHKDTNIEENNNKGVASIKIDNPSLSNFFFVSLFEGYMNGNQEVNNFTRFYCTQVPNEDSSFLIHVIENDGQIYISYCPKKETVTDVIKESIPLLSSLMPFVPRSIITKGCSSLLSYYAVEVIGYGSCTNYIHKVHTIDDDDEIEVFSYAYPINKEILEFAALCIKDLPVNSPSIRFAITGEFFTFKLDNGKEGEYEINYPDVNPSINSVFDSNHPTHLVFLIDKNYPKRPQTRPLRWLQDEEKIDDEKMLIDVASNIMCNCGYAERSADLFFVNLGGGYPTVEEGEVPENIREKVGFSSSENDSIKFGIQSLIHEIISRNTEKEKLKEENPMKKLSSTNSWENYPIDEELQENIFDKINHNISTHFHLNEESVQCSFIGNSMLVIRIENLDKNKITDKISFDFLIDENKHCKANDEIAKILNEIKLVDFQVTHIDHEPTIGFHIRNMKRYRKSENDFNQIVKKVTDEFGFLVSHKSEYIAATENQDENGIFGEIFVELIGIETCIVFSKKIAKEFKVITNDFFSKSRASKCMEFQKRIKHQNSPEPNIKITEKAINVMPEEIEQLKNQIAIHNQQRNRRRHWKLDTNYNVLIVPLDEEQDANDIMYQIRQNYDNTSCLYLCDPPPMFLPDPVFAYQNDGTVKKLSICQKCAIEYFKNSDDIQFITDKLTHRIIYNKIRHIYGIYQGFAFIDDDGDANESWPQIPLGQGVFALMSDPTMIPLVKSWFILNVESIINSNKKNFTFCPNHPSIIREISHHCKLLKCPFCSLVHCRNCFSWHNFGGKCDLKDEVDFKRCPNCNTVVKIISGDVHVYCICGKHWCYRCGSKSPIFNTAAEYYEHAVNFHNGNSA